MITEIVIIDNNLNNYFYHLNTIKICTKINLKTSLRNRVSIDDKFALIFFGRYKMS